MIYSQFQLVRGRHIPVEPPILDYIRGEIPSVPNLFMYRHSVTGNFILCEWVSKEKGTCVEIHSFGQAPTCDRAEMKEIRQKILKPLLTDEIKLQIS